MAPSRAVTTVASGADAAISSVAGVPSAWGSSEAEGLMALEMVERAETAKR